VTLGIEEGWGANQDIIHPQREGHDEMLMVKEQHAALDPNRLRRERKSLKALVARGVIERRIVYEKVKGWKTTVT